MDTSFQINSNLLVILSFDSLGADHPIKEPRTLPAKLYCVLTSMLYAQEVFHTFFITIFKNEHTYYHYWFTDQ
jgi:hypothetical protein